VTTGWGTACNTAKVEPGSVCVVFGAGGVGLSTIQGCQNAGAKMMVAVDMLAAKLEMARVFGATHVVDASKSENLVKEPRKLTGGGADYAFECVGHGEIVAQGYGSLRKGGTAVVVRLAGPTTRQACGGPASRSRKRRQAPLHRSFEAGRSCVPLAVEEVNSGGPQATFRRATAHIACHREAARRALLRETQPPKLKGALQTVNADSADPC
jgi:Zn-dependent alcohol dehydrogenase